MLRLLEGLLFLLPFAGYALWLWQGKRYTQQLLWGTIGAMAVMVLAAAWLELTQAVPPDMAYVPPHMDGDRVVPGRAIRRTGP
ncbi:MAG: hypothetical protein IT555_20225 [Acetobacteraceae bacterium]|nr:hypothetical protein [Acetobacteraceae bacterium]